MISKKIIELTNEQIVKEFYASNLYLQMSAWAGEQGYEGSAAFLRQHSSEELSHMIKFFDFLSDKGEMATIASIPAPPNHFENLYQLFQSAYEHELLVTKGINNIVHNSLQEQDYTTFGFLQWFITEQMEEEKLFQSILDRFKIIGTEEKNIFFVDREIGQLVNFSPNSSKTLPSMD